MRISFLAGLKATYFNERLDFRAQIFNTLGFLGCALGLILGVFSIVNDMGLGSVVANFVAAVAAAGIIRYANRTGTFRPFFLVTVILMFFMIFPALFFMGGGYLSGMPCFFVFAVVFTVIMLEGRLRAIFTLLEFALYTGCFLTAFLRSETVSWYSTEAAMASDIIVGCFLSSAVLAIAIIRHISIYDQKQKDLAKANDALAGLARAKTEFIANASHEIRTPLTVVSINVQTVKDILQDMSQEVDPEAWELLDRAQNEVLRLSRMVEGLLMLAAVSESVNRQKVDFSLLLQHSAETLRLSLGKRGNVIETDIEKDLAVFGSADLLAQVLINLLQNAGAHMENGRAMVSARKNSGTITVTVRDTGTGIAPELLPHVFERGVSTGGTGLGLPICQMIIESHGGRIWIENEPDHGTAVYYTLPVYEGQFGGGQ